MCRSLALPPAHRTWGNSVAAEASLLVSIPKQEAISIGDGYAPINTDQQIKRDIYNNEFDELFC
jgi:hypothetical protein